MANNTNIVTISEGDNQLIPAKLVQLTEKI